MMHYVEEEKAGCLLNEDTDMLEFLQGIDFDFTDKAATDTLTQAEPLPIVTHKPKKRKLTKSSCFVSVTVLENQDRTVNEALSSTSSDKKIEDASLAGILNRTHVEPLSTKTQQQTFMELIGKRPIVVTKQESLDLSSSGDSNTPDSVTSHGFFSKSLGSSDSDYRKMRNRLSSAAFRQKKADYVQSLEEKVSKLERENSLLKQDNLFLRQEVDQLRLIERTILDVNIDDISIIPGLK